jgi:DNA primase
MQSNIIKQWLNDRGITDDVIARFNLSSPDHPQLGECLRIPITKEHSKYRRHPLDDRKPKYIYDSGSKVTLYGADQLLDLTHGPVLITEGELDTLVAWSNNIPAVSSTGGAMSFQAEWATALVGHDPIICFDNDKAGAEGMVRTLGILPHAKVLLLPYIPNGKDLSDYVARGGDLHALVSTARHYADISDVEDDKKKRAALSQQTTFHEAYIDKHREQHHRQSLPTSSPSPAYEGNDEVLRAKTYPMDNLLEFKQRKCNCPFHRENTPSFHYYPKTNSAYCFGGVWPRL